VNPDDTDVTLPPEPTIEKRHNCRICGHAGPEPQFCPVCLAETMR
jgi:hypothetical protein